MRDLAAFFALAVFLTAFYVLAAHGSGAVQSARLDAAVTLTATR